MNQRERDEFKPECERCGQLITDIDWCDTSTVNEPDLAVPGYMRCSTDGCFNARGSRLTNPIRSVCDSLRESTPVAAEFLPGLTAQDRSWIRDMSNARFDAPSRFAERWLRRAQT